MRDAVDVAADALMDAHFPEPFSTTNPAATADRRARARAAIAEALRSAANSGAEAMREAVQADLSAYIDKNEARIAANPYEMQDRILLEERVMALDAARSRVAALPLPAPGAPASPWRPIEEAPKDEAPLIVGGFADDGRPWSCEARYIADNHGWWMANTDPTDAHDGQVYPSCFMPMPLPTPPTSKDT